MPPIAFRNLPQLGALCEGGGGEPTLAGCTRLWARRTLFVLLGVAGAGCADPSLETGEGRYALAEPGPWHIPPETLALGEQQYVDYTGAGPWIGEEGCGGGLLGGAEVLRDYIYEYFPQTYEIGGYACRSIVGDSSSMSVHATGRALDVMIYTIDGAADNSQGDPIGNWLIENAEYIGIQYIIWDRWSWGAHRDSPKDRKYTGSHPHHDHLHIELSVEAADLATPFFQNPMEPPDVISCGTVAPDGGVIDERDQCAGFYGPGEYWRSVDGAGHGGSLLWTDAFESSEPSNWARWRLDFEEAGRYRAEVYLTPDYAVHDRARYEIVHGGEVEVVYVDQSQASAEGWYSLGEFDFTAGGGQTINLFDNVDGSVAEGQHIAFDALRLTRTEGSENPNPDSERSDADLAGGCTAADRSSGTGMLLFLLLLAGRLRSRRART